jgi:hypothetical protein
MLDDLRDAEFAEEDDKEYEPQEAVVAATPQSQQFLGMTPVQRFVIALLILMMVCILGSFCLLITETVWLQL